MSKSTAAKMKEAFEKNDYRPLTAIEIAKELGLKEKREAGNNAVRRARRDEMDIKTIKTEDGEYKYKFNKPDDDINEEIFDEGKEFNDILEQKEPRQNREWDVIDLDEHETVILVIGADWHVGKKNIDYEGIKRVSEWIGKHDNCFFLGLGDLINNATKYSPPTANNQIADPSEQARMLSHLFNLMCEDSILRIYDGNHEAWLHAKTSISFRDVFNGLKSNGGVGFYMDPFYIKHGNKEWKFFCRHKARKNQTNSLHGCQRAPRYYYSEYASDADFIISAHNHKSGMGIEKIHGQKRYMLAAPSMVKFDYYAESSGFASRGDNSVPAIVLRKNLEPRLFLDVKEVDKEFFSGDFF